jgi:hypothetical protein
MTGYETYIEGHGVFRVEGDSLYTGTNPDLYPWFAFNDVIDQNLGRWRQDDDQFTAGGGPVDSRVYAAGLPNASWLVLHLPYEVNLKGYSICTQSAQSPGNIQIWGSNNGGTSWTLLHSQTQTEGDNSTYQNYTLSHEGHYSIIAYLILTLAGSTSTEVSIRDMKYFGTPAPSGLEDGHLTLGKALTLPRVSGHPAGAETPRAESLVVHYDTTVDSVASGTTVVDISGTGNNGTLNNGAAYSSTDRSLNLDATGDSITIGNIGNQAGAWVHSVSFWIYFLDLTSDRVFEVSGSAQDKIPHFVLESDGDVRWDFYSSNIKTTSQPIAPGIWYHVALSYNGGVHGLTNSKIYINGVSSASEDNGSGNALNIDANRTFLHRHRYKTAYIQLQTLRRRPHRRRGRPRVRPRTHREVPESHRYGSLHRGDSAEGTVRCEGNRTRKWRSIMAYSDSCIFKCDTIKYRINLLFEKYRYTMGIL